MRMHQDPQHVLVLYQADCNYGLMDTKKAEMQLEERIKFQVLYFV